jgi:hypothetical protein
MYGLAAYAGVTLPAGEPLRSVHETLLAPQAHGLVMLGSDSRDLIAAHYAQLDEESLYSRFFGRMPARAVEELAGQADFARDIYLGIVDDGQLLGLAQLAWSS